MLSLPLCPLSSSWLRVPKIIYTTKPHFLLLTPWFPPYVKWLVGILVLLCEKFYLLQLEKFIKLAIPSHHLLWSQSLSVKYLHGWGLPCSPVTFLKLVGYGPKGLEECLSSGHGENAASFPNPSQTHSPSLLWLPMQSCSKPCLP